MKQRNLPSMLLMMALVTATAVSAFAVSSYLKSFKTAYPSFNLPECGKAEYLSPLSPWIPGQGSGCAGQFLWSCVLKCQ